MTHSTNAARRLASRRLLAGAAVTACILVSSACVTAKMTPLAEGFASRSPTKGGAQRAADGGAYIGVLPFEDARPAEVQLRPLHAIPVVGFFTQYSGYRHPRPEETASEFWFGHYSEGSWTTAFPSHLAAALEASGSFTAVEFNDAKAAEGRYDYLVRGRLLDTTVEDERWDFGLNAFSLVNASIVPHLLGAPHARRSARVAYELSVVEQKSGRVLWTGRIAGEERSAIEGTYYGRSGATTNPYVRVVAESFESSTSSAVGAVRRAIAATSFTTAPRSSDAAP